MARTKKNHVPLGILIRVDERNCNGEYFAITGTVVTTINGQIRNGTRMYDGPINGGIARIESLAVSAMGQNAKRENGVYGFSLQYEQPYSVDLRQAEEMLKTLKFLSRGLDKIYETRGSARSFGEYVGRVCEVLGGATVIETVKSGSFYSEGEYRFHSGADGVLFVDRLIHTWQSRGAEASQAS